MENSSKKQSNKQTVQIPKNLFSAKNIVIAVLVLLLFLSFLGVNLLFVVGEVLQVFVNMIRPLFDYILGTVFYLIGGAINVSADVTGDVARTGIDLAEGAAHSVGNLLQNEDNVNGPLPQEDLFYKSMFEVVPVEERQSQYEDEQNNIQPILKDMGTALQSAGSMAEMVMREASVPVDVTLTQQEIPAPIPAPMPKDLDKVLEKEKKPEVSSETPSPSWCLVGNYGGKRSCMTLEENETCVSGQVYQNQEDCLQLGKASAKSVLAKSSPLTKHVAQPQVPIVKQTTTTYSKNWGIPPPVPPPAANSPPMGSGVQQGPYIQTNYYPYMSSLNLSPLPNPYYGAQKYRMQAGTPHPNYVGPVPGTYLTPNQQQNLQQVRQNVQQQRQQFQQQRQQ